MSDPAPVGGWKLGTRVLGGFCVLFAAVWLVQLALGVGPNWILRYLGASENLRVFVGSTLVRLGVLAAIVLFTDLALRKVPGTDLQSVAFSSTRPWKWDLIFGFVLAIMSMAFIFGIEVAAGWLIVEGWSWQSLPVDAFLRSIWISLLSNLDAGVGEEVLFRAFLLYGLSRAWGKPAGLIIVAGIFAAFHLLVNGAVETNGLLFTLLLIIPGIVLGDAYMRTGSLWLPIGIHFTWDLAYDIFNFTGGSHPGLFGAITTQVGPSWFVGTDFGIETGLAGVLVAAAVWFGAWVWTRHKLQGTEKSPGFA